MYSMMKKYSESNPNKFNDEIIYGLRQKDDIYVCLERIHKALETIKYVKYLGMEIIEDENKFKYRPQINTNDTRLNLVIYKFQITFKDEVEIIEMPLFVPKLINNYFYLINGTKYYSIYQIVDENTYNTKDSIILKSLLMPIIIRREMKTLTTLSEKSFNLPIYQVNLFNRKINMFHYFFAKYGWTETLELFGINEDISLVLKKNTITKTHIYFGINKTAALKVSRERFKKDSFFRACVNAIIDIIGRKSFPIKEIKNLEFWKIRLGMQFTNSNQLEKGETVLLSFERLLDEQTKTILRIPDEDKDSIYSLIKWMVKNFNSLKQKDNLSLDNKRLRINEYIISAHLRKMSTNTYRILNTKTPLTMARLKTAFKVSPMFLIKSIITSELLRYNNAVNDQDLFNCALKYSARGPQSIAESGNKSISPFYRAVYPSHVEKISLNSCSASDPGLSGSLTPFIDTDGFYLNKEAEYLNNEE